MSCKAEVELRGNVVLDYLRSSCSGPSCDASLESALRPGMLPPFRSQSESRMRSSDRTWLGDGHHPIVKLSPSNCSLVKAI